MPRRALPIVAVLLVPFALILGIWAGGHPDSLPGFVRDAFVSDTDGRVYEEAVDKIASDYYRKVDRKKLLNKSLSAAVQSLDDRFSHYFDPGDYKKFNEATTGEFEGVGMTVQEAPQGLRVLTVFKGGPAAKAGLKRGDVITEVDGEPLKGKTTEQAVALVKGRAGTPVRLTILSDGKRRTVTTKRAEVSVPVVESRMEHADGKDFAYVSLAQFTSGAHGEVSDALRPLLKKGADGVVLDLRDNGGGLLQEGVLVSSVFIPDGTIVTTRGRSRPSKTYKASGDAIDTKIPVVVLVNDGTASAAEIVTGALQDRDRATVVGTRTFGKGVFQEIEPISNGGALDITVGEYFTPKGRNLGPRDGHPGGITPDVSAKDNPDTPKVDEGLEKALSVLADKAG
jgi:carboxyl-terminal processing protease